MEVDWWDPKCCIFLELNFKIGIVDIFAKRAQRNMVHARIIPVIRYTLVDC